LSGARQQPRCEEAVERGIGLTEALSSNLLVMIGVGPFLTLPLMVRRMGGPHILYAWFVGAVLALADALVYAQLGAALPGSGGPYVYLREAYQRFRIGPLPVGRLLAFLFIFQMSLTAPLSVAGGAIGFADYLGFFFSDITPLAHDLIAALLCVLMTALLYRNIKSVGRLSVAMVVIVMLTIAWIVVAGLFKFSLRQSFDFPADAFRLDRDLVSRTGAVALLAMFNYGGYNNLCNFAGEVRTPHKTLPRAIVGSVFIVVAIYVVMSTVILGSVPWRELQETRTIATLFVTRTIEDSGRAHWAAPLMNALILFVTAASLFGCMLGYSRVPFAAAQDGQFFRIFGRLHPTKHFPHVSLVSIGLASIPFCFVSLGRVLTWLILVQIAATWIWVCAGVVLVATYRKDIAQPFRMWLFPVPAIVALFMWLYVFAASETSGILFTFAFLACGVGAFFLYSRTAGSR
jgi:amino acid transporter